MNIFAHGLNPKQTPLGSFLYLQIYGFGKPELKSTLKKTLKTPF